MEFPEHILPVYTEEEEHVYNRRYAREIHLTQ